MRRDRGGFAWGDGPVGQASKGTCSSRYASGAPDVETKLTPREQEVLRLVADGQSAPDIAARLYIETSTVKTHLQNIYEKLGVSERAAAVAEGMRRGLLE